MSVNGALTVKATWNAVEVSHNQLVSLCSILGYMLSEDSILPVAGDARYIQSLVAALQP